MKKLAVLFMAVMLLLCAAAQAETVNLSGLEPIEDEYGIYIPITEDTVITGSTEYPVTIGRYDGEITLRDVQINNETNQPGLWITGLIQEVGLDSDESAADDTIMVKLEGGNFVNNKKDCFAPTVVCDYPLAFTGDGSLFASGSCGLYVCGSITLDGGHITAVGSGPAAPCALFTEGGSLTVNGGSVIARYSGTYELLNTYGAYMDSGVLSGKVIAGSGYVIKAGETAENAVVTSAYNGEMYLEVSKPALPETGDGANLAVWTAMLAASALGLLAMGRKAREY